MQGGGRSCYTDSMPTYRNLVFKGGGVRGIAYLGALQFLYEKGLMRSIERVAGTSAGAITATVLSMNFSSFDEIHRISDSLEYRKVPSEGTKTEEHVRFLKASPLAIRNQFRSVFKNVQCSMRFIQDRGWYSSDYFYTWLKNVIAEQFTVAKDSYTFADFRNPEIHAGGRDFLDLYITGTDISNRMSRVFSYETTPDMEVALAARISMSIPFYFESIEYQYPGTSEPQSYADGGIMWNYPINLFDDPRYGKKIVNGVNTETLGMFIFTSPSETRYKKVDGLVDYLSALFESLLLVQEHLIAMNEKNKGRTIFIDDKGVPSTYFDVDTGDETYRKLYDSGYESARAFFENRTNWDMFFHGIQAKLGWNRQ